MLFTVTTDDEMKGLFTLDCGGESRTSGFGLFICCCCVGGDLTDCCDCWDVTDVLLRGGGCGGGPGGG